MPTFEVYWSKQEPYPEQDCACSGEVNLDSFNQDSDTDCACGDVWDSLESLLVSSALWQSTFYTQHQAIENSYEIVCPSRGENSAILLNENAYRLLKSFETPLLLTDVLAQWTTSSVVSVLRALELFTNLGLIVTSPKPYSTNRASKSETISAWLHITDRCNLRCAYCYLPHVREDMSPETGRAVIDATFRSTLVNGFQQVKLKYAGGEPLLRFPLIEELHRYAQALAEQNGFGLEGAVLSNGTLLTAEIVETLKSLSLRLMISLDGLGQYHDSHRRYAGGRGSFADVSEAVDLALALGLTPNISVTVSSRTVEGLPEIMAWILERDLPFSLNFYRENDLSVSHEDMRLDEQKIINGMLAAFKVIENNLPRRPFLGGIIDRANLSTAHTHTCGVGQNYLVFDQNGQVAKCQMHIRKPITDIYVADPLAVIRADQIGIQNISVEEKEGCKTCEWKHWCAGGCPLATYRATGRYDVKSPNCNIYKALFPEALRLEGLRLLKYQDDSEVVQKVLA